MSSSIGARLGRAIFRMRMYDTDSQGMFFGSQRHPQRILLVKSDMPDLFIQIAKSWRINVREGNNKSVARISPAKSRKCGPFQVRVASKYQPLKFIELG